MNTLQQEIDKAKKEMPDYLNYFTEDSFTQTITNDWYASLRDFVKCGAKISKEVYFSIPENLIWGFNKNYNSRFDAVLNENWESFYMHMPYFK